MSPQEKGITRKIRRESWRRLFRLTQHSYDKLNLDYCGTHVDSDNFDRDSFDIPDTAADNSPEDIRRFADTRPAVPVRASCFESDTADIPSLDCDRLD